MNELLLNVVMFFAGLQLVVLILIYAERKVSAHMQCRLGPMRVGWHGTLQPVADAVKLFLKESPIPSGADRLVFMLAPIIPFTVVCGLFAVVPSPIVYSFADLECGLLFAIGISSVGVLGILFAGWGSRNKYALLGGMRTGAQVISYELSASLALLVGAMLAGSMRFSEIIASQEAGWWLWRGHVPAAVAFAVFLVSSIAECNRTPFDIVEGESELTGGFHTEYGGMRFGLFYLAEFLTMFALSCLATAVFLGGGLAPQLPLIGDSAGINHVLGAVPGHVWFFLKAAGIIFLMMWARWTLPRLRVDQVVALEWKFLLPLSLINLIAAAVVVGLGAHF